MSKDVLKKEAQALHDKIYSELYPKPLSPQEIKSKIGIKRGQQVTLYKVTRPRKNDSAEEAIKSIQRDWQEEVKATHPEITSIMHSNLYIKVPKDTEETFQSFFKLQFPDLNLTKIGR